MGAEPVFLGAEARAAGPVDPAFLQVQVAAGEDRLEVEAGVGPTDGPKVEVSGEAVWEEEEDIVTRIQGWVGASVEAGAVGLDVADILQIIQ